MDSRIEALKRVDLFARCTRKELEHLVTRMDEVEVPPGQKLTRQGRPGDSFYVILEGQVEVRIDDRVRAELQAGDFLGEISMLDRGPATATALTVAPARLLVMSHAQFRDAIKANERLLGHVMFTMAQRLRRDELERYSR